MKKTGMYYEGVEIDQELQELIKVMNQLDWIETTLCCFGHAESEYHKDFYIQFFCDVTKVNTLAKILEEVQERMELSGIDMFLKCEFNFISVVAGSQFEAPENSISFYLYLENFQSSEGGEGESQEDKLDIVNWLAEGFEE